MNSDLPFIVEYTSSGKTSCITCNQTVVKDSLRVGIMVQSHDFDGKVPLWHHFICFFTKNTGLKSTSDVANFDNLRWEDQEIFKKNLEENAERGEFDEFLVETAKSSRATCKRCATKIKKDLLRISKTSNCFQATQKSKPVSEWYHIDCLIKIYPGIVFSHSAEKLSGFSCLSKKNQTALREKFPLVGMKRKSIELEGSTSQPKKSMRKEDRMLKLQSNLLFEMRDNLKEFTKKQMTDLLKFNDQYICKQESRLLDHLSDCLVFGALKSCPICKNAKLRFKFNSYYCPGNLTEWTKCQYETKYPEREEFHIPEDFKANFAFLQEYRYTKRERQYPETSEVTICQKKLPLTNFKLVIIGKLKPSKSMVTKNIQELGGIVVPKVDDTVQLCISNKAEVERNSKQVTVARDEDIHIVSVEFLDAIKNGSSVPSAIEEHKLASCGGDPILKFGIKKEKEETNSKANEVLGKVSKSVSQNVKIQVEDAITVVPSFNTVDPASGLKSKAHIYIFKNVIYNAVLGAVDVLKGSNSYFKLQILEADKGTKYWLFRSWGRVGTTIGGKTVDHYFSAGEAISQFENLYFEKSGNHWFNRDNFEKKPGCMYPLEIDYALENEHVQKLVASSGSKLHKCVQDLICLVFDISEMKNIMLELEIDLDKMPLGKLSKNQIKSAYKILGEAQEIILNGSNSAKIIDLSNRFYTLMPHNFGMRKPTLLDDEEYIKTKIEMLDSLLDIELAYNLLYKHNTSFNKDPVDAHYEKLNCDIEVLSPESKEFQIVQTYFINTHSKIHNGLLLHLNDVFKINRHGEAERFKNLHNKKLLWHGSRVTNFVGILSQGLRIAPPEAPKHGYMFGKGIYFADMVSKSAKYCSVSKSSDTGLLLLCEVALGNMYEKISSEFVTKLPKDKHSTKGMGGTIPDPKIKTFMGDVEVPYGPPIKQNLSDYLHLLPANGHPLYHNEYIVYDVSQIKMKYLLSVSFSQRKV